MNPKARVAAVLLSVSAAGFGAWQAHEGFTSEPVVPTRGDVPTIGHGSTRYEDGTRVRMSDPPITRERGAILARNLMTQDEKRFTASIPGVKLHQEEFDLYMDFVGQYGVRNWEGSSMRARLMESDYRGACRALLDYRFMTGPKALPGWEPFKRDAAGRVTRWRFDCSTPGNRQCMGVWTRQAGRYERCMAVQ